LAETATYSDSELVTLLRSGDDGAMKMVYHNHFGMIKYMVTKNSGSMEDAEDIFQESLFILYNLVKSKEFELTVKIKTIIYSIARNLWLNELRKRGKAYDRMKAYERYIKVDMSSHGNFVYAREAAYKQVEKAFRILGEKCQKILTMYYFHHRSMDDIAVAMEYTNADNAKNQKYRCIQNLKRMI